MAKLWAIVANFKGTSARNCGRRRTKNLQCVTISSSFFCCVPIWSYKFHRLGNHRTVKGRVHWRRAAFWTLSGFCCFSCCYCLTADLRANSFSKFARVVSRLKPGLFIQGWALICCIVGRFSGSYWKKLKIKFLNSSLNPLPFTLVKYVST